MIDFIPDPVAFTIGSFPVLWYGIFYAVGLAAVYLVLVREARRRDEDPEIVGNALIIVAIAALIGGRLYHVIDQWARYKDDLITAILPITRNSPTPPADAALAAGAFLGGLVAVGIGIALRERDRRVGNLAVAGGAVFLGIVILRYLGPGGYTFAGFAGLGVPGGIITGTITAWYLTRRWNLDFWTWADIVAPALFVMQAIGRLGNFFNQELYGPPTTLPWGIAIDCTHRIEAYACGPAFPEGATHFHPLFLYESLSGLIGFLVLTWLAGHAKRLVAGDLLGIFFIWYGTTRFVLEFFRSGNWTFFGIPTAQIVTLGFILFGVAIIVYRHGPGRPVAEELDDGAEDAAADPDADADADDDGDSENVRPGAAQDPDAPTA